MSVAQYAFLKKENVPGKDAWQKAIDELNFSIRLEIDPELEPFEDEGFSPCKLDASEDDVGFEIYYEPIEDVIEDDDDPLKPLVSDENDYCISLCWRGSMKDCATGMIASAALAKSFGALVSYDGDEPYTLDALIEETKNTITEAQKDDG